MSRQRTQSPRYRRFPWDEPDFDPQKVIADLDGMPMGRGEPEENWDYRRDETFPQSQRRHPQFQQHHRRSEETFQRRRLSPYHDSPQYTDGGEGPRRREKFRENAGRYEDRRGATQPEHNRNYTQRSQSNQREPGWRQEQPEHGTRERFRDRSPLRPDEHRQAGQGRGQQLRNNPNTDRRRPNQDRSQQFNRNRREMDGSSQFGYGREEPFEQRYSVDDCRQGFNRNTRGPLVIEHDHNPVGEREPPRREQYSRDRDLNQRPRSSRSISREDVRGGHFEETRHEDEGYHEARRSPFTQDRPNYTQYRDGPSNQGGMSGNFNRKGGFSRGGRGAPQSNRPQQQREHANPPIEQPRSIFKEDFYEKREPAWEPREQNQTWRDNSRNEGARGGEVSTLSRQDLKMQLPREQRGRTEPKSNMMVITEETLTIKVDMSRPVNKNSSMLYSSDRQLSLDLVNVGRQRLDFLPMMEHSGTYRENTTHTGTFAEEIITLVHQVKDQYFGGEGIPLNERFSAPQKSAYVEEEPQEMTLSERFGAKRGVNVNLGSLVDSEEPLFSRQGPLQLSAPHTVRDPDDLRHDLEKRRQERLEGVKVTIAGQHALPQRPLGPKSEPVYDDNNDVMDDAELLNWSEEPNRRPEGSMGQRRGGTFRQNNAPFRRNNRQMRRGGPNYRNNTGGPNW